MNTQVKERLTGAVILVALVVLLVPELLTGPSHATPVVAGNAEQMPLRSYTIDLGGGGEQKQAGPVTLEQSKPAPAVTAAPVEPAMQAPEAAAPPAQAPPPQATAAPASPVEAPAPKAAPSKAPAPTVGWSVQLGSFVSRDNAQRLVRELKAKGFTAFILEGGGSSGRLYRVRVGPAADRAAATALASQLRAVGQPGSVIPPASGNH